MASRGGRVRAWATVCLVVVSLLSSGLTARSDPGPTTVVPLGAETVILADRSSSALVSVDKRASFSLRSDGEADLTIHGPGRIVALTLQPASSAQPYDSLRLIRYNGCFSSGCAPDDPEVYLSPGFAAERSRDGSRAFLKPGAYKLGILVDGGPVRARLRLSGLSGSVTLSPGDDSESGFVELRSTSLAPSAASAMSWSAGAEIRLTSANSLLLGFVQQSESPGPAAAYACHFSHGARPAKGHYLPTCPAEGGDPVFNVLGGVFGLGSTEPAGGRLRAAVLFPTARGAQLGGFHVSRFGPAEEPSGYLGFLRLD